MHSSGCNTRIWATFYQNSLNKRRTEVSFFNWKLTESKSIKNSLWQRNWRDNNVWLIHNHTVNLMLTQWLFDALWQSQFAVDTMVSLPIVSLSVWCWHNGWMTHCNNVILMLTQRCWHESLIDRLSQCQVDVETTFEWLAERLWY